jgi:hypothetical protein
MVQNRRETESTQPFAAFYGRKQTDMVSNDIERRIESNLMMSDFSFCSLEDFKLDFKLSILSLSNSNFKLKSQKLNIVAT